MAVTRKLTISFSAKILTTAVAFATMIVTSRNMGPESFGLYKYMFLIVSTTILLGSFGMFEALRQQVALQLETSRQGYQAVLVMCGLIWLVVAAGSQIAGVFINLPVWFVEYRILLLVWLGSELLENTAVDQMIARDRVNVNNILALHKAVLILIGTLILLGIDKLDIANVIRVCIGAGLINLTICQFYIRQKFSLHLLGQSIKDLRGTVKRAAIIFVNNLSTFLNYRIDVYILSFYVGFSEIGCYTLAVGLMEKLWLVPESLRSVVYMEVSTKRKDAQFVASIMRLIISLLIPATIVLIIMAHWFIPLVFSQKFEGAVLPFVLIAPGILAFSYAKLLAAFFAGKDRLFLNTFGSIISLVLNVGLNFLLIPKYGINGAALSSTVSYTMGSLAFVVHFSRLTGIGMGKLVFINRGDLQLLIRRVKGVFA